MLRGTFDTCMRSGVGFDYLNTHMHALGEELRERRRRSQSGPSKRSDDGFLDVLKSSDVSPRPHFFDIRISIAQTPINQSLLDIAPTTHAPMVPIVNITRRGHTTPPPDLAVAARGCSQYQAPGIRRRKALIVRSFLIHTRMRWISSILQDIYRGWSIALGTSASEGGR